MLINWYPGHMKKHLDITRKNISNYEIILMIIDARLPWTSQNTQFKTLLKNKLCIYVVNKIDLVDAKSLNIWKEYFAKEFCHNNYLFLSAKTSNLWKIIYKKIGEVSTKLNINFVNKQILVIGIPNVGKSYLINNLAHKSSLKVANRAGLTQNFKLLKLTHGFEVTDTPGILWPKFNSDEDGIKLAIINAIKKEILPIEEVLHYIVNFFYKHYYNDMAKTFPSFLYDHSLSFLEFIEFVKAIAKDKHFVAKNNELDLERTYDYLFKNFNNNTWFLYCLELPNSHFNNQ